MQTCVYCQSPFDVSNGEQEILKRFDVPIPQKCARCRDQNRIAFRNESKFYRRECNLCKKPMIALYSGDKPYTIYCSPCWWSDAYDPLKYGRDYDFNRPFFDQYKELADAVPKPAVMNMNSENCDYSNYASENRNCYLVTGTLRSEDCFYSDRIFYCNNVFDSYDLYKCQRSYECIQCTNVYECTFCQSCDNCSSCDFCFECVGCKDCFGCINLRNKQFYIFNKPYSESEYRQKVAELKTKPDMVKTELEKLRRTTPHRATHTINCENSTGDQLYNCKNCRDCYTFKNSEECANIFIGEGNKFCYDSDVVDNCELVYNSANFEQNYDVIGGNLVWYTKNARYVTNTFNSNDVFGCIGLKKNQYCILNKQYSKEDYEALVPKIIDHMKKTGEWGDYFPIEHAPFAYNETIAQEHWPLTQQEATRQGLKWKSQNQETLKVEKAIPAEKLPASIADIPDDILNWAIECELSKRPFRIVSKELAFYREMQLPIPHLHPEERHHNRYNRRQPRMLFDRTCAECQNPIQTTYGPDRPEKVVCEHCYLKNIY
ncbi:hypothetical protein IPJ72_05830 [Candidatus Peregrinibacteria bacterium]|nr:MAG: hypothetical protein IPJ72_05830 [Candidatus Peregrinibacteria bacterium]